MMLSPPGNGCLRGSPQLLRPTDKAQHENMVSLVERMLALHKNHQSAKTPQEKESVQRQVEPSADGAIDKLVYELYGLTEEEIKIVES